MSSVQFDLTSVAAMQQIVGAPGAYDGSYVGRASVTFGAGASLVRCRARRYGTDGNNLTVQLYDAGAPNVVAATTATLVSANAVRVSLRRNAGALLATADEVAAAINGFRNSNNPAQQLPVVCHSGGAGVVAAAAATALTGGLDPQLVAPLVKFTTTANGGLFYFDQTEPLVVRQMLGKFAGMGGPVDIAVQVANLDGGLDSISAETATIFTGNVDVTQPYVSFADASFLLLPYQAVLIVPTAPLTGMVQLQVQYESAFRGF